MIRRTANKKFNELLKMILEGEDTIFMIRKIRMNYEESYITWEQKEALITVLKCR